MKKLILALGLLSLLSCSEKLVVVTTPVNMRLTVDEVKGTKVIFTISSDNPEAYYSYTLWNDTGGSLDGLIEHLTSMAEEDYQQRMKNEAIKIASFADLNCFRGTRTIRATRLTPDSDFLLLAFQLNPETHEVIGPILSEKIHTPPVEEKPLEFQFLFEGKTITIIPSDPNRSYYWAFDSQQVMYDNYLWPFGWFYSLVDMYEQYDFMDNLTTRGKVVYNAGRDSFKEGEMYSVLAVAYEDGEMTSGYVEASFKYLNGVLTAEEEEVVYPAD
jgi:hypothetical protein